MSPNELLKHKAENVMPDSKYPQNVVDLANQMGVHPADVLLLAQSVANGIEQDRIEDIFLSADENTRAEMTRAYTAHANRKYQQFVSVYLTRNGAQEAFADAVLMHYSNTKEKVE